jgi:hypothetical protein
MTPSRQVSLKQKQRSTISYSPTPGIGWISRDPTIDFPPLRLHIIGCPLALSHPPLPAHCTVCTYIEFFFSPFFALGEVHRGVKVGPSNRSRQRNIEIERNSCADSTAYRRIPPCFPSHPALLGRRGLESLGERSASLREMSPGSLINLLSHK